MFRAEVNDTRDLIKVRVKFKKTFEAFICQILRSIIRDKYVSNERFFGRLIEKN